MSERGGDTQTEEKMSKVRRVFSKLNIPVDIRKVPVPGLNKYAVVVKGKLRVT